MISTPDSVKRLEEEDRRTLDFAVRGDGEGFYRSIQQDGDRRKVCGEADFSMPALMR